MNKYLLAVSISVAVIIAGLILTHNVKTTQAQETVSAAEVMSKLQEVINNQQAMMQKLDAIYQELEVVKIRATRK